MYCLNDAPCACAFCTYRMVVAFSAFCMPCEIPTCSQLCAAFAHGVHRSGVCVWLIAEVFRHFPMRGFIVQHVGYQWDACHAFLPIPLAFIWNGFLPVNTDKDFFLRNQLILLIRIDPRCFHNGSSDTIYGHTEIFHVHRL